MTKTPMLSAGPAGPANLQAGAHRAWRSQRPARLYVQQGRVWVTASDRLDDHFVDAGMSLVLPAHADVLIGAERDSRVRMDASEPAPVPRVGSTTMAACPTR